MLWISVGLFNFRAGQSDSGLRVTPEYAVVIMCLLNIGCALCATSALVCHSAAVAKTRASFTQEGSAAAAD